jgi:hypothetical protein
MGIGRLASAVSLWAALLAPAGGEAATGESKQPNFPCENCAGGPGPFNGDRATDLLVKADGGHRQRLLNARGLEKAHKGYVAFNLDQTYLQLVSLSDGRKLWVLNVRQRMPEPQASRTLRRYY